MRRPHLLLFISLAMLPLSCTKDGSGNENATETSGGDGDGDPGDGDPGDGDGDPGDGDPGDGDPGCTPGSFGCACDDAGQCVEGLACIDGECAFDNSCVPGTENCECDNGMCEAGFECVDNLCEPASFPPGPYPNCGWNPETMWNMCGFTDENPAFPVMCPPETELAAGQPCPQGFTVEGCCDLNGNNWWCEGGTTAFENCPGGDGDGDGDGDPTGDGDGDGDGDPTGDGDGDPTGDGDGDPTTGDGDGEP
jgi:hypothetical protein